MSLLGKYGFDSDKMHSYSHLKSVVEKMPDEKFRSFQMELSKNF
jgi:hypothetical protein